MQFINQRFDKILFRLWLHLPLKRRLQLQFIFILIIAGSFAEIVSIGAVIPFLAALTAPEKIFGIPYAQLFLKIFCLDSTTDLLMPLTLIFCILALIAGVIRFTLLWLITQVSYKAGSDLGVSIYKRTLYQPYAVHISRNSSEIINGIIIKSNVAVSTIIMTLNLLGSIVMFITILVALITVEPFMVIAVFGGLGSIYGLIVFITRKRLLRNSEIVARESTMTIKSLQDGLGGIRDVLLNGSQLAYCEIYQNADLPSRRAQGNNTFITGSPRQALEVVTMVFIGVLAYSIARKHGGISEVIPMLGVIALASQRLIPVMQQGFAAWSVIQGGKASLEDTLELLDQSLPQDVDSSLITPIKFRHYIMLKNISFRYGLRDPWVLKNFSLKISKGSRVGFIGTTGAGKSTLLDILMGLLEPSRGNVLIDDMPITSLNQRAWQKHISHVPQTIYLSDSTIAENIAFGQPKNLIDYERVQYAASQAQIDSVINTWPNRYDTIIGEGGVRLSGGQRQRIGIARALYKQSDVIIFDEATSSLDNETEQAVIQAIEILDKELTVLIIAHRLTTLKNCTQIVEISGGGISRVGTYKDIIIGK